MRRYEKMAVVLSMSLVLGLTATACNTSKTEPAKKEQSAEATTEAISDEPVIEEVSEDEMIEATGIDLPAPEEATDVIYSVITTREESIAQMEFKLDGKSFYLRACPTGITELNPLTPDSNMVAIVDFDFENGNISGLTDDWTTSTTQVFNDSSALVNTSKKGSGYIAWLDAVPGLLYNLCMNKGATQEDLLSYADKVFVPLQGDDFYAEDIYSDFETLLADIYATKAGSAGSSERVATAADSMINFVENYSEFISEDNSYELADGVLSMMLEEKGSSFIDNFKECFNAVNEAVLSQDSYYESDTTYQLITNSINEVLDSF